MCDFLEIILGNSKICLNVGPFLITVVSGITNIKKKKKENEEETNDETSPLPRI